MLKYENVAEVGDKIKAFDFEPMDERRDRYLIGEVIEKGHFEEFHADMFKVKVVKDEALNGRRVGKDIYVPFEMMFDFEGRVEKV